MNAAFVHVRFDESVRAARLRNASDVHLQPGCVPVARVDGELETLRGAGWTSDDALAVVERFLGTRERAQLESAGDVSIALALEGCGAVRLHAFRTARGVALAVRLLAQNVPSLEALQLPPVVTAFAQQTHGLLLVAGPTGSGKSTTLAALVDHINATSARHIMTVEDPIEYRHEPKRSIVTQREAGRDVASCADAVYGALRSDPNVLLVGEMRDTATMRAVLTAAETGHLVLSTLHTGDAPQTIDRIVDAFDGAAQPNVRSQIAQTLIGVVCQRLFRRPGGGRRAAVEIMVATDAVRNLIREGKTHLLRNAISTNRDAGMIALDLHISELRSMGEIDTGSQVFAGSRA